MSDCPVCGTVVEAHTETYVSPYNKQEYKKYECPTCDVHWWEPLKIIPEFYESETFESYVTFHEFQRLRIGENHKAFFENIPKDVKGRLLHVGCGDGVFLKEAQKHGFEVWGIDFDRKSVETAKRHLGVDTIYAMSLEEFYEFAKERNLKFDVITFFEVLEHQGRPMEFLRMVKELLKDSGYIAGSVPNNESIFWEELHRKNSWGDYPPHHFLRFSRKALYNTLKIAGCQNIEVLPVEIPQQEFYVFVERKLFGNLDRLKVWLKTKIIGDKRIARSVLVEDLNNISSSKSIAFLKFLKRMRNLLLYPFTLFYLPKLKTDRYNLYFQAKI